MKKIKFLGVVTARKDSKRVKNKNLILINKKPILEYSFIALKKSKKVNHNFITSNCDKMLKLGLENNINVIKRLSKLALSNSTSESTLIHAINFIKKEYKLSPENIIFVQ